MTRPCSWSRETRPNRTRPKERLVREAGPAVGSTRRAGLRGSGKGRSLRRPAHRVRSSVPGHTVCWPVKIRELLARRSDLSTFVVHLTRDYIEPPDPETGDPGFWMPPDVAFGQIIRERLLRAGSAMGWARDQDDPDDPTKQTQRVIAFSETPLEHTWAMFAEIEDRERQIELKPYGLAMTKVVARRLGVNPVWYVDMTPSGHDWLSNPINELRDQAIASGDFHEQPIAQLLPFFDWMGGPFPANPTSKEFWWEREWRHRGDLHLAPIWAKIIWLCPEGEHDEFRRQVEAATPAGERSSGVFVDPSWGLEEIVARLAGFPPEDISVFTAAAADDQPGELPPVL
jgi:hypothetical protein